MAAMSAREMPTGKKRQRPAVTATNPSQQKTENTGRESQVEKAGVLENGRLVGTRTPDLHRVKVAL
jgi:hypothetical protein